MTPRYPIGSLYAKTYPEGGPAIRVIKAKAKRLLGYSRFLTEGEWEWVLSVKEEGCGISGELSRPDIRRPKIQRTQVQIPPDGWFDELLPHCPNNLAALLVFVTLTGRRITEALEAIDNGDGTVTIGKTKTGGPVMVMLPNVCRDYLERGGSSPVTGARLWSFGDRHNVYRALRKACKRAGVPYYGTHAIGRHAFATRLLREGKSLKFVADAGGWASIKMPAQHYAHLEKSEIQEQVKEIQERWALHANCLMRLKMAWLSTS